jgi:hypothetical protein
MAHRYLLELVNQLREERICDLGDDESEQPASSRDQRACVLGK